jgi:hypothetical protein
MEKEIRKFLILLRELQKINPEFPLQYAVCLAEIALDEGMSLTHALRAHGHAAAHGLAYRRRLVAAAAKGRAVQAGPRCGVGTGAAAQGTLPHGARPRGREQRGRNHGLVRVTWKDCPGSFPMFSSCS